MSGQGTRDDRWGTWVRPWLLALIVASITWFAFEPSLDGRWLHWDDDKNFVENEAWRGLSAEHLGWMFTTFHQGPYQPLSWITLGLDYTLFGSDPRGYHVVNVILQMLAGAACLGFARALFARVPALSGTSPLGRDLAAFGAALAFAVHPLRVESVAWVTERRDVVSGFFFMLTCWAWVHAATAEGRARTRAHVLALSCYLLSLLGKGSGFPLPVALLLLDVLVLRRWNGALRGTGTSLLGLVREKSGFIVLAVCAAVLAWLGQRQHATPVPWEVHGLSARLVQCCFGLLFYAGKTAWPFDLVPLVGLPKPLDPSEPRFLAGIAFVVVLATLVGVLWRRAPAFAAAWLSYAAFLAPILGLTQTGPQLVADRYSYLACIPLMLLAAGALLRLARDRGRVGRWIALAAFAPALALVPVTRQQSLVWHEDVTLWQQTIAVQPRDASAFKNLTQSFLRDADAETDPARRRALYEEARDYGELGSSRFEDSGLLSNTALAYSNLAELVPEKEQAYVEKSLEYARRSLRRVVEEPKPSPTTYLNAGLLAAQYGRPEEAIAPFAWLADHSPGDPEKPLMLGQVLVQAGRPSDALRALDTALELAPDSPRVWIWKAHALASLERRSEAITCLERGIRLAESLPPEQAELPAELDSLRALLASWKSP